MLLSGRAYHVIPSSFIYDGFGGLFVPFVLLSSFSPINSKGRKKHAFFNISTKRGWFYTSADVIYMLHFAHIKVQD
ncbi:hypothetical protein Hanom_Chr15g01359661 [Helianthus anomalus]